MEYKIFWCKTNKYFTEKWLGDERLAGKPGIFVSSCVVTAKADSKWKKFVMKHLRENADDTVYLSWCAPIEKGEIRADFFASHPEFAPFQERIILLEEDPEAKKIPLPTLDIEKVESIKKKFQFADIYTRKYLVIQTGCDNHCTFCLTVRARGAHKNRDMEAILEEIREFEKKGGKEVVLTGTNIGAWGTDNSNDFTNSKLPELIRNILAKTAIARIRISSLGVEFLSDELLELLKNRRMHAYVHLSIQSGSDNILKTMHRHYNRAELVERLEILANLQREDGVRINIGADLIVGFPGERDADFEDTLSIVRDFHISNLHAFPFSPHEWGNRVPAAHFKEQLDEKIKQSRWMRLMEAGKEAKRGFLQSHEWARLELLPQKPKNGAWRGYSENHIFLDAGNFAPDITPVQQGIPVIGTYHFCENTSGVEDIEEDE